MKTRTTALLPQHLVIEDLQFISKKTKHSLLWRNLIKLTKQILFDFEIFHNSLQHEVRALDHRSSVCGGRHVLQHFLNELFTCLKETNPVMSHISLGHHSLS